MMPIDEIKQILTREIPDVQLRVSDSTGGGDHFLVEAASEKFRGLMLIKQHQLIQNPLRPAIQDGRIHALSIKTFLPETWATDDTQFNILS